MTTTAPTGDRALAALETVDIEGIEILAAGGPYFGTGSPPGGDVFDVDFLQSLADANNALAAQVKVPIKLGHSSSQKLLRNSGLASGDALADDEKPAAGWLDTFRVDGSKLLADAKSVPKKIAELMQARAFRTRSVEMGRVTEQTEDGKSGRTFDQVVTALALLGAKAPAVRTLDDVLAMYGEEGKAAEYLAADEPFDADADAREYAVGDIVWDSEQGTQDLMSDISAILNGPTAPGSPISYRYYVSDLIQTDMKSGKALVSDYSGDNSCAWVVPYTIGEDGEPVPAPSTEWTLASQKWVQRATDAADAAMSAREHLAVAIPVGGADTPPMSETNTVAELSDEQVVTFAAALGIEESDPAACRTAVLAGLKTFTGDPAAPVAPAVTPAAVEEPVVEDHTDDTPEIAALRRSAALGEKAFTDARDARTNGDIAVAIAQGRIDPADKAKWQRFYGENEELARDALLSIPPQPRRTFGADGQGDAFAEAAAKQGDTFYGTLAGQLGVRPFTLEGAAS